MNMLRSIFVAFALCALAGCGLFSSSKSVEPRQLHVTLIGGSRLNLSPSGEPRPVETCVYIVRMADWVPMASAGDSSCAGRDQDAVVSSSRHVIAPNQVLQFWIDVPTKGEIWLVADADYAQRPAQYAPLRLRVDGSGVIHLAVWFDAGGIYNALLPGPVPVAAYVPVVPDGVGAGTKFNKRSASSGAKRVKQ
ncbi:type VI secretion lipoprotein TssJ [Burkholderia sp. TSV86]|uniref:type VI secretion lipoprotein TssJ n=1 Tax=Burkholderia sp. TSV86 TaxID=1385594 RepID=UPI0009E7EFF5|nr:type VI secretion lipoprotein TssJ [Burkholderia sp. TSV86]